MKNLLDSKLRFFFWLILFFGLLIFIPITLQNDLNGIAKGTGVFVIILLFIALSIWRHQTFKKKSNASPVQLNANDRFWLNQHIFFYRSLSNADRLIFENRLGLFLANIEFRAESKALLDKSAYLYVASSFVMSYWPFHFMDYQKISAVMLHDNHDEQVELRAVEPETESDRLLEKYFIYSSLSRLKAFFDSPHPSEQEVLNLKAFLEDGPVSSESFPSIISPDIRLKMLGLVDFTHGNKCFDEMYTAFSENKSKFSIRYPYLLDKMVSVE